MSDDVRLLVGTEHGLVVLRSSDGGESWSELRAVMPDVEGHALRRSPDGAMYLGTRGQGLFRSRDLENWEPIDTPPVAQKVRSLCAADGGLLVGTEAVVRPSDGGTPRGSGGEAPSVTVQPVAVLEWTEAGGWKNLGELISCPGAKEWFYPAPFEEVHVRHVSIDPAQPQRVYAAMQVGGVAISPDYGRTWYDRRNLDVDVHMVEPHPRRPGVVYAGSGGSGSGLYRSIDSGETWEGLAEECGNFVVQFALDPRDPDRIYLGTARGRVPDWPNPGGARGEMFRSDDGGMHWRKLAGGLPEFMESRVNVVHVDPEEPDHVYFGGGLPSGSRNPGIARDAGVYHSPNGGESWRKVMALDAGEPLAIWAVHD